MNHIEGACSSDHIFKTIDSNSSRCVQSTLDDDASMISSSTVLHMPDEGSGDLFPIPPPPKHLLDGEEFECPYCFTLCPRKMLRQEAWQ